MNDDNDILTKFLTANNQREVFVKNVQDLLQNDPSFGCLLKIKCNHKHLMFVPFFIVVHKIYVGGFLCVNLVILFHLTTREVRTSITCHRKKKLRKLTLKIKKITEILPRQWLKVVRWCFLSAP